MSETGSPRAGDTAGDTGGDTAGDTGGTAVQALLEAGPYRLVRARHGLFLANPNDQYIGRAILRAGVFSESERLLLDQLLPESGAAVEVGANMGALTVPMARKLGPRGLLWAFEPQPLVFQLMAANLALNGLVNVVAEMKALGGPDAAGTLGIRRLSPSYETNHGGIGLDRLRDDEQVVQVPIEPLDRAIDPPRLDLLKVDVEGMELDVLKGAAGLIARHRPALYVENHWPEASPALIRAIQGMGYDLWWHLPPILSPAEGAASGLEAMARISSKNMVCLPSERKTEVKALRPVAGPEDHPKKWD